jgi:hypothetical protein
MNNTKPDLNYDFPYPIEGEEIWEKRLMTAW